MRTGDQVYKPTGYEFAGTVLGAFETLAGARRVVVESKRIPGLLHIFAETQLTYTPMQEGCSSCRHPWYNHEREIQLSDTETVVECGAYAGMGDWCGCKSRIPDEVREEQEKIWR